MKIYDISAPLSSNLVTFPGDPKLEITPFNDIEKGDSYNISEIKLCSHTGTHIDSPKHFFSNGQTIDNLPLTRCIGKAKVFNLTGKNFIDYDDIKDLNIEKDDTILFKTDNKNAMLDPCLKEDFVYITENCAKYLTDKKINAVGIDYLSIESLDSSDSLVHKTLLKRGVLILEGLILTDVPEGEYEIVALPLKLQNGNGSPARIILTSK